MYLALKYAFIGKTVLMAILYIPLLPLGVPISLAGLIFFYFVEKWNITQRYKRPPNIDASITFGYLYSFRFFLFVYAISFYVFYDGVYTNYFRFTLFSIIFYGVLVVIPYARVFKCDLLNLIEIGNYEEEYFNFTTKYETQNPVTKKKANFKFLSKLLEKGIISDKEYSDFAKRLGEGEFIDLIEFYRDRIGAKAKVQINNLVKQAFNSVNINKNTKNVQENTSTSIINAIKKKKTWKFQKNGSKVNNKNERNYLNSIGIN